MAAYKLPWDRFVTEVEKVAAELAKAPPSVIVSVSRDAMPIAAVLAERLGVTEIVHDSHFTNDERLPSMYYVVDKMAGDRRILVVDSVCKSGRRLSVTVGDKVKTFAFIVHTGSKFVPDYTCLRAGPDDTIVFPWNRRTP